MNHPNLSPEINRNISKMEESKGIDLKAMTPETTIIARTKNTTYLITKEKDGTFMVSGHEKYCPVATRMRIHGCTWGGSMIKAGWLHEGMYMEMRPVGTSLDRTILTTPIEELRLP